MSQLNYAVEVELAHKALDDLGIVPRSRDGNCPPLHDRINELNKRTVQKIATPEGYQILMQRDLVEKDQVTVFLSLARRMPVRDLAAMIEHEVRKLKEHLVLTAFGCR